MVRICLLALALLAVVTPARADGDACVAVGAWFDPASGAPVTAAAVLERAAEGAVVLLGEVHDNPDHHRWQLQTMAALQGRGRTLVLGFEMFPRRAQPVHHRSRAPPTPTVAQASGDGRHLPGQLGEGAYPPTKLALPRGLRGR